jgi:hypothetical protein
MIKWINFDLNEQKIREEKYLMEYGTAEINRVCYFSTNQF